MGRVSVGPRPSEHVIVASARKRRLGTTVLISSLASGIEFIFPFGRLVERTSVATLLVFAMVNLALLWLRLTKNQPAGQHVRVPIWVAAAGLVISIAMISATHSG